MYDFKEKIEDYTEAEFIELLGEFRNTTRKDKSLKGDALQKYLDDLIDYFVEITGHPARSDLIFYPEKRGDEEPENIVKIIREWRRSQGLPLFKDSK